MRSVTAAALGLALTVIIFFPPTLLAEVRFGLKAGANIAQSTYDGSELLTPKEQDDNYRTVFGGGATVEVRYSGVEYLTLESGILIQQKGGATHLVFPTETYIYPDPVDVTFDVDWKYLYLTVPLRARFSFASGAVVPYVITGLDLDILLSAKTNTIITSTVESGEQETDVTDDTEPIDLGLVGGVGLELPTGERVSVFLEVTYYYGLADVVEPPTAVVDVQVHNRVIAVMGGVRFSF
jgi:hypothetical protein